MANVDGAVGVGVITPEPGTNVGSRFNEIRAQLLSDPYKTLPPGRATIGSMFKGFTNILLKDSFRRVDNDEDMTPAVRKLLHSVGICFFGRWRITEKTDFTGCFRTGTDHLIIVRCSTLLSHTHHGERRGFGLAGKIFPTTDPNELVRTANFVTIDNLGGTFAQRFTDVALTNEPPLGPNLGLLRYLLVILNVTYCFNKADELPTFRALYQLGERGLLPGETAKYPRWMQLRAIDGIGKSDAADFRDELRLANYKDGRLRFSIEVASEKSPAGERLWRRIGEIDLTEDVCSKSADERIRFRHLPNRGHMPA